MNYVGDVQYLNIAIEVLHTLNKMYFTLARKHFMILYVCSRVCMYILTLA